jgi:hypothetical protein
MPAINNRISEVIAIYEAVVKGGIEQRALGSKDRAYGGIIRAGMGGLTESIGKKLVKLAWLNLRGEEQRLSIPNMQPKFKISIKKKYIDSIENTEVKNHLKDNFSKYYYLQGTDIRVLIDNKLVLVIECKTYTENAMLKRILVDFTLLKEMHPNITSVLLQLESQLGGDYSELNIQTFGSPSTHTLISYFDVDLNIITLLKGERKVNKRISMPEFYKPLEEKSLLSAIKTLSKLLEKHV